MTESDFEKIARGVVKSLDEEAGSPGDQFDEDALVLLIIEQFRQVWNARGAADGAKVEAADATAEPLGDVLDAIRSLDR